MTQFALAMRKYRHQLAIPLLQRRIAVNVDDGHLKWQTGLHFLQTRQHVVAQVAPGPAV